MTLRSVVLAFALVAALFIPASAQIPAIQAYVVPGNSIFGCGERSTVQELIVELRDVNDVVAGVDFMIDYPPSMIWLADQLPDARYVSNEVVTIGSSPGGIAIAWHSCCMQDASQGLVVLRPLILWVGECVCGQVIRVKGYAPLGKADPSYVRASDFTEHAVLGLTTSYFDPIECDIAVQPTTWGKVKSLYR